MPEPVAVRLLGRLLLPAGGLAHAGEVVGLSREQADELVDRGVAERVGVEAALREPSQDKMIGSPKRRDPMRK